MTCANCDSQPVWMFLRTRIPFCDSCLPAYLRPQIGDAVSTYADAQAREAALGVRPVRKRRATA